MNFVRGLVCSSRDGSLSLTKLAAATAHLLMAGAFFRMQVLEGAFDYALWVAYGGFAIAHATYDKTAAMWSEYKSKKEAS